jgi:hypothetical protein
VENVETSLFSFLLIRIIFFFGYSSRQQLYICISSPSQSVRIFTSMMVFVTNLIPNSFKNSFRPLSVDLDKQVNKIAYPELKRFQSFSIQMATTNNCIFKQQLKSISSSAKSRERVSSYSNKLGSATSHSLDTRA